MFSSGFFNSLNGDRRYDGEQISSLFDGLISDGVFANVGEQFAVVPSSGMNVLVKTGRAWFNHTWSLNDTWMTLTVDAPDPLRSRIDSVVLEVNHDLMVRENSIKIVKGSPASSPVPPTMLHTDVINQYRLANITVDKDTTTITTSHIQVTVGMIETPFVTAPIQSVDVSVLFQQWEGQFQEWFDHVKDQLSGDVAANLQKQVDERVKIADKASESDILEKTEGKWVESGVLGDMILGQKLTNVGDIVYSFNDLEKKTDGKFLKLNGELHNFETYENTPWFYKNNLQALNIPDSYIKLDRTVSWFSSSRPGGASSLNEFPFIADGNVLYFIYRYTSSSSGYIIRYDLNTDEIKQVNYNFNGNGYALWMTIFKDYLFVFASDRWLYRIDKNLSGSFEQAVTVGVSASITAANSGIVGKNENTLVLGTTLTTGTHTMYFWYTTDGKNWSSDKSFAANNSSVYVYSIQGLHQKSVSNLYKNSTLVLFNTNDGQLTLLDFTKGTSLKYTYPITEAISQNMIVIDDNLYIYAAKGFIYLSQLRSDFSAFDTVMTIDLEDPNIYIANMTFMYKQNSEYILVFMSGSNGVSYIISISDTLSSYNVKKYVSDKTSGLGMLYQPFSGTDDALYDIILSPYAGGAQPHVAIDQIHNTVLNSIDPNMSNTLLYFPYYTKDYILYITIPYSEYRNGSGSIANFNTLYKMKKDERYLYRMFPKIQENNDYTYVKVKD